MSAIMHKITHQIESSSVVKLAIVNWSECCVLHMSYNPGSIPVMASCAGACVVISFAADHWTRSKETISTNEPKIAFMFAQEILHSNFTKILTGWWWWRCWCVLFFVLENEFSYIKFSLLLQFPHSLLDDIVSKTAVLSKFTEFDISRCDTFAQNITAYKAAMTGALTSFHPTILPQFILHIKC